MDEVRRGTQHTKADRAETHRKGAEADCKKALDQALDVGLEETFPGSDPVAITQPVGSGCAKGGG
jgi:hypothetical protein